MALGSIVTTTAIVIAVGFYYAMASFLLDALAASNELQEKRSNPVVMIVLLSWVPIAGLGLLVVLSYYRARYLFGAVDFGEDYHSLMRDFRNIYP